MRTANKIRTPCELLRKINDLAQGDDLRDLEIRLLCAETERETKRLAQELSKYKKEAWKDWWEENKTWQQDIARRLSESYKQEGSYVKNKTRKGK